MCACQVTMERAEPFANISDFKPQQSVLSTRTQPRINKQEGEVEMQREKKDDKTWVKKKERGR